MLVLSRKEGERIHIGSGIVLTVLGLKRGQVRLGIDAPEQVTVLREEIYRQWKEADRLKQDGGLCGRVASP